MSKFIFVTGGVCSSLGKGVAASALGSLLECHGLTVAMMKCDPYINVDAGTISPYQHGEVYVTADGAETDLDLGNYSRFTKVQLTQANSITTGKIYEAVIRNERAGKYNGRTVQVIPHITDEIKRRILYVAESSRADVTIVEIGGTVGDIESIPFLEAARQLIREQGRGNALSLHVTLIPTVTGGERKTKPTQHSVKQMQEIGIQPDVLLCRAEKGLEDELRNKLALFCNVEKNAVLSSIDVEKSLYELPLSFHSQGLDTVVMEKLGLTGGTADVSSWEQFLSRLQSAEKTVTIGMVGKKSDLDDCYKSVREALLYAATAHDMQLDIKNIDAEKLETSGGDVAGYFDGIQGILIPGGYGQRGFLGLLAAIKYAREQHIPYLGIDLGMQLMAVEMARSVLDWEDADSTEYMPHTTCPVISLPEEHGGLSSGGMARLGNNTITLTAGSLIASIYGCLEIVERHRNEYEFNREYAPQLQEKGLLVTGLSLDGYLAESFEWKDHPWALGVQFHPEFVSRPGEPHKVFSSFIGAASRIEVAAE
ncbi:MAG: CTP synthase [Spirochaetaceae bacterium]|nr:CTP synthase [Spirochaetaceae bacterium]